METESPSKSYLFHNHAAADLACFQNRDHSINMIDRRLASDNGMLNGSSFSWASNDVVPRIRGGSAAACVGSLPGLFHRKLRVSENEMQEAITSTASASASAAAIATATAENDDFFGSMEELESHAIGSLLPDDEEELLDEALFNYERGFPLVGNGDDVEESDIFSSGGGLELDSGSAPQFGNILGGLQNSQTSVVGEHPYGEHPSRTLFVRNINSNVEDSELQALFEQYGAIRTLYTACKHRGFVMISYYDIRAARTAMRALQNKPLRRRKLDIHFSIPKDNPSDKDVNQGTLVVFNLDASVSNDELRQIFGAYGEVKEIRETPHKRHHKFIEFYDVRAAEAALRALNRSDIAGKRIKLEPSRPGGARRSLMQQLTQELELEELRCHQQQQQQQQQQPYSPPAGSQWGGVTERGSCHRQPCFMNKPLNGVVMGTRLSSPLRNGQSGNQVVMQQQHDDSPTDAFSGHHHLLSLRILQHHLSHSLPDQTHLDSSPASATATSAYDAFQRCVLPTVDHQQQQQQQQQPADIGLKVPWNGYFPQIRDSPPPLLWPSHSHSLGHDEYGQQLHQQFLPTRGNTNLGFPLNEVESHFPAAAEVLAWNHRTLVVGGGGGGGGGSDGIMSPHSHSHHSSASAASVSVRPFDVYNDRSNGRSRRGNNGGGDVGVENKKYQLDLERILAGEDSRTTLMVKNIPNKYTSKMLLTAIDEHHRGTYDFLYLPIDFKNKCNVGYAFINMIEPAHIVPFFKAFNGKKWEKFNSEKVAFIAYARIQGKGALVAHFQNSSLMNEDKRCRPILFHSQGPNLGDPEPFPVGPHVRTRGKVNSNGSATSGVGVNGRCSSSSCSSKEDEDEEEECENENECWD